MRVSGKWVAICRQKTVGTYGAWGDKLQTDY